MAFEQKYYGEKVEKPTVPKIQTESMTIYVG